MTAVGQRLNAQINNWLGKLTDTSRRNPLLYFKPSKRRHIEIMAPTAEQLFAQVVAKGKTHHFWVPPPSSERYVPDKGETEEKPRGEEAKRLGLVCTPDRSPYNLETRQLNWRELGTTLNAISKKAGLNLAERGVRILYLSFGMLEWHEANELPATKSPLIMVPVELSRASRNEAWKLCFCDEDIVLNPTLAIKLQHDFNITLPDVPTDWDDISLGEYLAAIRAAVKDALESVREEVWLGLFDFHKLPIYHDLDSSRERLAKHPIVSRLVGERAVSDVSMASVVNAEELDEYVHPRDSLLVVDADSSQLAAIETVKRGTSLVLHGPPGTGKSQTITNVIAEMLSNNKSVLFVSEKMAALEVVHKRICDVGLESLCLELHSYKASRKAVVDALYKTMNERVVPDGNALSEVDLDLLYNRREQLNDYVMALHVPRPQFGRSVRNVIGELNTLRKAIVLPIDKSALSDLTAESYDELKQMAARLAGVWKPIVEGSQFPWYGFKSEDQKSSELETLKAPIDKAKQSIKVCNDAAVALNKKMGLKAPKTLTGIKLACDIVNHCKDRPTIERHWLADNEIALLPEKLKELREYYERLSQKRAALVNKQGDAFVELVDAQHRDALHTLHKVLSERLGFFNTATEQLTPDQIYVANVIKASEWITGLRNQLAELSEAVEKVSIQLQLPNRSSTIRKAHYLFHLVRLCTTPPSPQRQWFGEQQIADCSVLKKVSINIHNLSKLIDEHKKILETFHPSIFQLNVRELYVLYQSDYTSPLALLRPRYWRDSKAIRNCSKRTLDNKAIRGQLKIVLDFVNKQKHYATILQDLLGPYYCGIKTDVEAVQQACQHAHKAIKLMSKVGHSLRLLNLLSAEEEFTDEDNKAAERLREAVEQLRQLSEHAQIGPIQKLKVNEITHLVDMEKEQLGKWLDEIHAQLAEPLALVKQMYDAGLNAATASITDLDQDIQEAMHQHTIQEHCQLLDTELAEACGERYQGVDTDWDALITATAWTAELFEMCQTSKVEWEEKFENWVCDSSNAMPSLNLSAVNNNRTEALARLKVLAQWFEPQKFPIAGQKLEAVELELLLDKLQKMRERLSELPDWLEAMRIKRQLTNNGLERFAEAMWSSPPQPEQLEECVRTSVLHSWLATVYQKDKRLGNFQVADHERLLRDFQELDEKHWLFGTARVISQATQQQGNSSGYVPTGSQRDVVRKEALKKRRHLPIRTLFQKIPNLITELKPCLLMSPLSVSQFLPQDIKFDLVIFDEASQIRTEDAIASICRGNQVLICGDQRQLPPTNFFQKTIEEEDDSIPEEEEIVIEAYDSVLDECLANGMQDLWLRWHYRSKDESLIAFSNDRFYDYRLVTFPSPRSDASLGVTFDYVQDGVYDRGGSRTNAVEAKRVTNRALELLTDYPDKSLGIVSFSASQTQAIEDELERQAAADPLIDTLLMHGRQNGFFVKNLENVQGDERDTMLFSIGYGKDQLGRLTMNFGPLNQTGGERRLNVAITRARERVILVSSIRAADLDRSSIQQLGVSALYSYLDFAERGVEALNEATTFGSREYDSPFEEDVAGEIRRLGYEVDAQVGCSGYRIDLGVRDLRQPGRYILGIECDGATYHSAYTARDRDRLRQQMLEAQGWRIHRIWSPAWFHRRNAEITKMRKVIEDAVKMSSPKNTAKRAFTKGERSSEKTAEARTQLNVEALSVQNDAGSRSWTKSYKLCKLPSPQTFNGEFHDPSCVREHASNIARVVAQEGPIHVELVMERLKTAWGLKRAGERMRTAFDQAVALACKQAPLQQRGDFLWPSASSFELQVRIPCEGEPDTKRQRKHIPNEELLLAMQQLAKDGGGIEQGALFSETARLFGIGAVRQNAKARLKKVLQDAIKKRLLRREDTWIYAN